MKSAITCALGALSVGLAVAQQDTSRMATLKALKLATRQRMQSEGAFDANKYKSSQDVTPCVDGKAGEYSCENVDLYGFLTHGDMGSSTREGNDIWGWTSPDGREFGVVGQTDGTAFVEVLKDGSVKYVGRLPTQTVDSLWRDMKVVDGYAYIGAEAPGHGMQVFDLRKLLNVTEPVDFSVETDMTAWFDGFGSSHNIVAHEEKNMVYAVGTQDPASCQGGLYMVDVSDPANPTSPGCVSEDGYIHDAQCVVYTGPDENYWGKEICFGYNEDTLTIMDVTDKANPVIISRTPYFGATYTHQGWLADEVEMTHLLLDDELDEQEGTGPASNKRTTTYVFDICNLKEPVNTGVYQSPSLAIDHNQYVKDGKAYQANYSSGLRIIDVSSLQKNETGSSMSEVGFFDVHPEDDAENVVDFFGSWSNYPYFPSGYVLINSIERGVYSVKYTGN